MRSFIPLTILSLTAGALAQFYPTNCTQLDNQCLSSGDPNEAECAGLNASCNACQTAYDSCRAGTNGVSGNQAECAGDRASCDAQTNSTYGITTSSSSATMLPTMSMSTSAAAAMSTSSSSSGSGFYPTNCTQLDDQCLSSGDPNEAECAGLNASCNACQTAYDSCRVGANGTSGNQAECASNRYACDAQTNSTYNIGSSSSSSSSAATTSAASMTTYYTNGTVHTATVSKTGSSTATASVIAFTGAAIANVAPPVMGVLAAIGAVLAF